MLDNHNTRLPTHLKIRERHGIKNQTVYFCKVSLITNSLKVKLKNIGHANTSVLIDTGFKSHRRIHNNITIFIFSKDIRIFMFDS